MRLLIRARNAVVAVEGGRIAPAEGRFDAVLEAPDAEIRPGLINAHDHLHRNHYGRLGRPPYPDAYAWARDIQVRHAEAIARGRAVPRRDALLCGAWKNLFSGVTAVVHHDPWEADFDPGFPVRVIPVRSADSLGMTPGLDGMESGNGPRALHLAEGVIEASADEVRSLDRAAGLGPDLLAVHAVGVDADGARRLQRTGAAVVWCPTSNLFLFGRTAPASLLAAVDVLLGSDSRLTGEGDLLDELRAARATGLLDDGRLQDAVGAVAARRLSLPEPSLQPGAPADFVLLARPLLESAAADVLLVIVGGAPRLARPDLARFLSPLLAAGREMTIGAVTRWTSARSADPNPESLAA